MKGPDFIGIGQQKAGTGWLYYQLSNHPDFWLPPVKELHFFDRGFNFRWALHRFNNTLKMRQPRGPRNWRRLVESDSGSNKAVLDKLEFDLEFYHHVLVTRTARVMKRKSRKRPDGAEFAEHVNEKQLNFYADIFDIADRLSGDITPAYAVLSPNSIRRITSEFGDTKYILQIRHPVSRTISQIRHYFRNGAIEEQSFANADAMRKLLDTYPQFVRNSSSSSIYANWSSELRKENLLVLALEEIIAAPDASRQKLAEFLAVDNDRFNLPADSNHKEDYHKVEIPRESVDYLKQYFASEVDLCRETFGQICASWE